MMTQQAQAALRRVIEQYTKNVRFCIICNYVNKIAPAIQSRCTRFRFSPLPIVEVEKRLDTVVEAEGYVIRSSHLSTSFLKITVCSVKLTADGKKALLKLSKGDMRRALNVLQACHAAYDLTGETEIYNCTGNPHPSDIETIVNSMLADEFTTSYHSKQNFSWPTPSIDIPFGFVVISALKTERGLALQDLLTGAYEYIETIEFQPHARIYLLDHLATTEYVLALIFIVLFREYLYLYLLTVRVQTSTIDRSQWKNSTHGVTGCIQDRGRVVCEVNCCICGGRCLF